MSTDAIDFVLVALPGDGAAVPSDEERQRADEMAGYAIPRTHPSSAAKILAEQPTNRAYLRAAIRRQIAKDMA